jgi:hypothetical protein
MNCFFSSNELLARISTELKDCRFYLDGTVLKALAKETRNSWCLELNRSAGLCDALVQSNGEKRKDVIKFVVDPTMLLKTKGA